MRVISLLIVVLVLVSCSPRKNKNSGDIITISGKIQNPGNGNVILEHFIRTSLETVDTLTVNDDGTYFSRYQPDEPGYYRINFYQTQFVNILFTGNPIVVNVDGRNPTAFFEVLGSEEMDYLKDLNDVMEAYQKDYNRIYDSLNIAVRDKDKSRLDDLQKQLLQRQKEKTAAIKNKIRNMGTSLALLQVGNYIDINRDFPFIDSVTQVIEAKIPDCRIKRDFVAEVEKYRRVAIGSVAPEIALPDPDGTIVRLSSLRGSYVLIDFWASWCAPCRKENPNIVRLYKMYHNKGFEIYGVSLDRNGDDWTNAIKTDGLSWIQVSDLKYFQSEAVKDYNIYQIPSSFLLDKEGHIIAKDLRGKMLEDKLSELL